MVKGPGENTVAINDMFSLGKQVAALRYFLASLFYIGIAKVNS